MFSCTTAHKQLTSSGVEFSRLFGIVCIYSESHQEIRFFQEMQMTANASPKLHSACFLVRRFILPVCDYVFQERFLINHGGWGKLFNVHQHIRYDTPPPQQAPFSAFFFPEITATEPCHIPVMGKPGPLKGSIRPATWFLIWRMNETSKELY
jgi:hypothetical protein